MSPDRLAVYGTLRPGHPNHHEVASIRGTWQRGHVRGTLHPYGWGAALGYPALLLDPDADEVEVDVLTSPALRDHWERLDAFEGPGYRRVQAPVSTDDGPIFAWLYEARD